MFAFLLRNRRKFEVALKIISFIFAVIMEAIVTITNYADKELQTAQ